MAKRSQRRQVRYERDHSGCMWGLISMFDFRHGRSTQKLISDRRRGSKHAVGARISKNKFDMLSNLDENCQSILDGDESTTVAGDAGKPSMKKLMEEEMIGKQDTKMEINNSEVEGKQSNSEYGGQRRKYRKKTNRSRTKSCELHIEDLNVSENLESEQPCLQNSKKQSTKNLGLNEIMEEFCHLIYQRSIKAMDHDQHAGAHDISSQKSPEFDEKLSDVIKLFITQKIINGNHDMEDGEIDPSKELGNMLQILSSNEELLRKLSQGPKSVAVDYVQNLCNALAEKDEDSNSIAESNLTQQELDLGESNEVINGKQRKFFRRKPKSLEKNASNGDKTSQASSRIVILKPEPKGLLIPETEDSAGTLPESQFIIRHRGPFERVGSHFFLSEIKRRLKHAIGKERQDISSNGTSKQSSTEQRARGDRKGFRENAGRNSPSKNHFFMEKIARPPLGVKRGVKTGISNIYIEAKKHLSDMLSSGAGDVDSSSRQDPKSLGRILSLPEYNFSPIDSPGRDSGQNFVASQTKLSTYYKPQKQENNVNISGQLLLNLETSSCVSDEGTVDEAQAPSNANLGVSVEVVHDKELEKTLPSAGEKLASEGDVEVVEATEIVIQDENDVSDTLSKLNISCITREDQHEDMSEGCEARAFSGCFEHDSHEENQPPCSPVSSQSTFSMTKKLEDLEGAAELVERPSPISVLEPLFLEEDISPAGTRSHPAELPMQPQRIQFEERETSAAEQGICSKTCVGYRDLLFEYVNAVLQASSVNWEEFYVRSHFLDQALEPLLFDEIEFFSDQLGCCKKLLFDCINEVLLEVYGCNFSSFPRLSFSKPTIRVAMDKKSTISEVWKGVCWQLLPLPLPHTLDQIVKKDMAKTETWMDLRCDAETVLFDIGEVILEDVIGEIALCE